MTTPWVVRMLMAPAGPAVSGPQQFWPRPGDCRGLRRCRQAAGPSRLMVGGGPGPDHDHFAVSATGIALPVNNALRHEDVRTAVNGGLERA